jgi:hypothetical protein
MGVRSVSLGLLVLCGLSASPALALPQPQKPKPHRIWVSLEEERDERARESLRKMRAQEETLTRTLEQFRARGFDLDDPQVFLIYRELRDLRRRIWRLERDWPR